MGTEVIDMVRESFGSHAFDSAHLLDPPWMLCHLARHLAVVHRSFPDLDLRNPGYVVEVWEENRTWEGRDMPNNECRTPHSANWSRLRISPGLIYHGARRVWYWKDRDCVLKIAWKWYWEEGDFYEGAKQVYQQVEYPLFWTCFLQLRYGGAMRRLVCTARPGILRNKTAQYWSGCMSVIAFDMANPWFSTFYFILGGGVTAPSTTTTNNKKEALTIRTINIKKNEKYGMGRHLN